MQKIKIIVRFKQLFRYNQTNLGVFYMIIDTVNYQYTAFQK